MKNLLVLFAFLCAPAFGQVTIDTLPPATLPLTGAENVAISQNKATRRATVSAIQSSTFISPIIVNLNTAPIPLLPNGATIVVNQRDTLQNNQDFYAYGGASVINLLRADGTGASPTPPTTGETLGAFQASGFGTSFPTASVARTSVSSKATQPWSGSAQGAQIVFQTTANNTTTPVNTWIMDQDGSLWANNATGANKGSGTVNAQGMFVNGIAVPTYPTSAAETAAGVTPSNFTQPVGNALRYGCDPTGVASSQTCLANLLAVANPANGGNGSAYIPGGTYQTTATLNRPAGVYVQGAGWEATILKATCNCAVVATTGSQSTVLNNGGVRDLTVWATWGANNSNTSAFGISESWTNRSQIQNVRVHGAFVGLYGIALWQNVWQNITIDGAGTQQNNTGVLLDQLPTTFPVGTSNAVQAANIIVQGVAAVGFRLLNPNGSKWVNCEAENGTFGWLIGNTSTGVYPIEFAHFVNDLADTNSSGGLVVQQGSNAVAATYMQFSNFWVGNSGGTGVLCDGCDYINFNNLQVGNNTAGAVKFNNTQHSVLTSSELNSNNIGSNAGIGDIWVAGGGFNRIVGNISSMANATSPSVLESGGTNNNSYTGNTLFQGATIVGAASTVLDSPGYAANNLTSTTLTLTGASVLGVPTGGSKGAGTINAASGVYFNGTQLLPTLSGTTGSIGGGALVAGTCSSGTATVTGATTSMVALTDPTTYPGDGTIWDAQVTSANTVTVKVCAIVALTPTASTYNVRVIQ